MSNGLPKSPSSRPWVPALAVIVVALLALSGWNPT
jgi:hypothetical protein